jgi:rfaE bifunctional protein kinase chain/domain
MLKKQEIKEAFSGFSRMRVLIVGDVMVDSYLWGKVDRISPEAPVPVVMLQKRESRPGGAANVALNIQAMGAEAVLCSVIGTDTHSLEFMELMAENRLDPSAIVRSSNRPTTTKFRIIGNNAHMLRVDEETDKALEADETKQLLAVIESQIEAGLDAIILEDYDKGVIGQELIARIAELANAKGIPVTADPKKRNFSHYRGITLFKPNLKEMKEGLKLDKLKANQQELDQMIHPFMKERMLKMCMVTLSEAGVYIAHQENGVVTSDLIPAHYRNITDVSGAGDTVISVTTLALAAGLKAADVAALANLAGGLVCEQVGVVPVDKDKLLAEALKKLADAE